MSRRWVVPTIVWAGAGALILVVVVLAGPLPLPCKMEPTHRVRHWRSLTAELDRKAPGTPILVRRYQVAALIRYYGAKREIAVDRLGWRRSQLDFWPAFRRKPGLRYLLVDVRAVESGLLSRRYEILQPAERLKAAGTSCVEWIAQPVRGR